jgi:hypothetical protein
MYIYYLGQMLLSSATLEELRYELADVVDYIPDIPHPVQTVACKNVRTTCEMDELWHSIRNIY